MPDEQRKAARDENTRAFIQGLAAPHWKWLGAGKSLVMQMLKPAQREPLVRMLRLYYYDPRADAESQPTEGGAEGRGVTLRLVGSDLTTALEVVGPGAGAAGRFLVRIPFYGSTDGRKLWDVDPPTRLPK